MSRTTPPGLRRSLDGYDVVRGVGRACPACERPFDVDDRLVVRTRRDPGGTWTEPSVVCSDCGRRTIGEDERRPGVEQVLVGVDLAATPQALVLDGETAAILDRSPADG